MSKYDDESDADSAMRKARIAADQRGRLREFEQKVLRIQRDLMARGMPKEDARAQAEYTVEQEHWAGREGRPTEELPDMYQDRIEEGRGRENRHWGDRYGQN
tara:strand:+ start:2749 stop:3054 length:306 start_codon:yes stop_codon:yes gene_type:complete